MKLRLHENTLRFRLSRTDVAKLAEAGSVEETVTFEPAQKLSYRIESAPVAEIAATFDGSRIAVTIPAAQTRRWADTDQVGIEAWSGAVKCVIEKDFECLHRGAMEDEAAFPNPARGDRRAEA